MPGGRFKLRVRPSSRIAAFLAAVMMGFLGLVWVVLLIAIAGANEMTLGIEVAWGFVAVLLGMTLWGAWLALREAVRRPYLEVAGDVIAIHNPSVLRRRLELSIRDVRAVAIDLPDAPGFWAPDDLPVEIRHSKGDIEWTAGRDENLAVTHDVTRVLVPLVDRDPEVHPNVAIVLKEPMDVHRLRRRTFGSSSVLKTMTSTKAAKGFLLGVREPRGVAVAMSAFGVVRKLDGTDADLLEPGRDDVRRIRRAEHVRAFFLAWFVLSIAYRIWESVGR